MSFGEFYQDGGVFMHVITLLTLIAGAGLLARARTIRRTFRDPNEQLRNLERAGASFPSLVAAIVMTGALGTGVGWISVHAALLTVPQEQFLLAMSRGSQIASYTVVWGLVCAVPLCLGHAVLRHFEQRLRALIDRHV